MVLVYADDVAFAVAHPNAEALCDLAQRKAADVQTAVGRKGLDLSVPKSYNFVISHGNVLDGVFRRVGPKSTQKWEETKLALWSKQGGKQRWCRVFSRLARFRDRHTNGSNTLSSWALSGISS